MESSPARMTLVHVEEVVVIGGYIWAKMTTCLSRVARCHLEQKWYGDAQSVTWKSLRWKTSQIHKRVARAPEAMVLLATMTIIGFLYGNSEYNVF